MKKLNVRILLFNAPNSATKPVPKMKNMPNLLDF